VSPPATPGFQATAGPTGGPERYFQGVVVIAEEVKTVESKSTTEEITLEAKGGYLPVGLGAQQIITGGNRLIIAALHDDWIRLKDFIASLDKAQPQVILEVLIMDVTRAKQNIVAGTVRSKTDNTLPEGVQFLSSNISNSNSVIGATPRQLQVDLLGLLSGPLQQPNNPPVTSLLQAGSLIMSFNDPCTPGIFGLLQLLDNTLDTKILSHPFLVTTNNQKATIAFQTIKRIQGDAVPGAAGVITIEIVDVPATIQVQMIPRLSSLERLSLQVAVDVNEFISPSSFTRLTRRVNTNANMASGQILVLGGLTQTTQTDIKTGTPFLQNIPIIGTFFSGKNKTTTKNNLAIFISPTIVQPKLRGGMDVYTADKIRKCRRDIDEDVVFSDTRDPITRIFFNIDGRRTDKLMRDYLSEATNKPDEALISRSTERRRIARQPKKVAPPPIKPVGGELRSVPA
jgi:type II secretory pathway component GspD/PulD (secretin)